MTVRMYCCDKCQIYWTCETKWYRGERGEENVCCPLCNNFGSCLEKTDLNNTPGKNKKKN